MPKLSAVRNLIEEAKFRLARPKPIDIRFRGGKGKLKVLFNFGAHEQYRDASKLGEVVKKFKPHVLCVENAGGTEQEAGEVEYILSEKRPIFVPPDPYDKAVQAIVLRHKPRVMVLERFSETEVEKLNRLNEDYLRLSGDAVDLFLRGYSTRALDSLRRAVQKDVSYDVTREKHVNEAISSLSETILARFPELEQEKEIRVVIAYGATHTPLYINALKSGYALGRIMASPTYLSISHKPARATMLGKRPSFTQEQLARMFVAAFITTHVLRSGVNYHNAHAFGNLLARRLSLEDFRRLSGAFSVERRLSRKPLSKTVNEVLEWHGLRIPRTKFGVHSVLRRHAIPLSPG